MKQICQICCKKITEGKQFTQTASYTRHDNKDNETPLWTEINIIGKHEYFCWSDSIKPLCKECATKLLENTIKTLRGDE